MLAVFILSFVYCVGDFCEEIPTFFAAGNNLRSEKDGFCYIVHAGGILWGRDNSDVYRGYKGSNSHDGLIQCAKAAELSEGEYFVELDFCFTADGHLVCIHNWDSEYIAEIKNGRAMTVDEFLASRIYGKYEPLTLDALAEFLRTNDELTVVTDFKEDFERSVEHLRSAAGDLASRFVVQIYRPEQYDTALEAGFSRIAYTLYTLDEEKTLDTGAHNKFAANNRLEWIAVDKDLCENGKFVAEMLEIGVPIYVHTVNEHVENYKRMGFDGVYTDNVRK